MDTCLTCGHSIPLSGRDCLVCNSDVGFPNVRAASSEAEVSALHHRYESAVDQAKQQSKVLELAAFEASIGRSKAVMNRSLGALMTWINGSSPLLIAFHRQVEVLGREPLDNQWDRQREAAEAAINPYCFRDISFAALTLDENGMSYYGPYSVVLRSPTIQLRSTVFDRNPFTFLRDHGVVIGDTVPIGYRSTWEQRAMLAVAKLHHQISCGQDESTYPDVIMGNRRDRPDCDFMEVHIFGPINRLGIERISGPRPVDVIDVPLWEQVKRKATSLGIDVEETPCMQ